MMMYRELGKRQRRKKALRRIRLRRSTLLVTATVLSLTAAAAVVADRLLVPSAFQVGKVRLEGSFQHLDPEVLNEVVMSAMDRNFFAVDLQRIEQAVRDLPWVYQATVRRVWPDSIHIRVVEQQPVARWGPGHWLNVDGEVVTLRPTPDLEGLVGLTGPPGTSRNVMAQFRDWRAPLAVAGLQIKRVVLTQRRAWTLSVVPMAWAASDAGDVVSESFDVVLGNRDLDQRLRRFIRSYRSVLFKQTHSLRRVDLRYPNGLAISLRQGDGLPSNLDLDAKT